MIVGSLSRKQENFVYDRWQLDVATSPLVGRLYFVYLYVIVILLEFSIRILAKLVQIQNKRPQDLLFLQCVGISIYSEIGSVSDLLALAAQGLLAMSFNCL